MLGGFQALYDNVKRLILRNCQYLTFQLFVGQVCFSFRCWPPHHATRAPYMPIGTLREALWFPAPPALDGDAEARAALMAVGLSALGQRLDETAHWTHALPRRAATPRHRPRPPPQARLAVPRRDHVRA